MITTQLRSSRYGFSGLLIILLIGSAQAAENRQEPLAFLRPMQRHSDECLNREMERMLGSSIARMIDRQVDRRIHAEMIPLSPQAGDGEFCRRVYIDIIGR